MQSSLTCAPEQPGCTANLHGSPPQLPAAAGCAAAGCSGPCWQLCCVLRIKRLVLDRPYMCHLYAGALQRPVRAQCLALNACSFGQQTLSGHALTCSLVCQCAGSGASVSLQTFRVSVLSGVPGSGPWGCSIAVCVPHRHLHACELRRHWMKLLALSH